MLFDELVRRPWFGQHMLRSNGLQANSMAMYERIGQQLLGLDLTPRQRFHAVSSIVSYVVRVAADLAEPPPKEFLESGLGSSARSPTAGATSTPTPTSSRSHTLPPAR